MTLFKEPSGISHARPRARGRGLALVATLALLASSVAAFAKTPVDVDISKGFARVVFELPQRPNAKAELAYDVVMVTFDQTVDVDVETLRQQLGPYVSIVRLDADGKTLRIAMQGPVRINQSVIGRQLALDLIPPRFQGEPPAFVGRPSETPAADGGAPSLVPDEAHERAEIANFARPARLSTLTVHAGEQPTLTRVVFDWPEPVEYTLDQHDTSVVARFSRPARADLSELRISPPRYMKTVRAEVGTESLSLVFEVADGIVAKDFRDGNKVVMDLVPRAPAPTPAAAAPMPNGPPSDDKEAIAEGASQVSAAVAGAAQLGGDARAVLAGHAEAAPPPPPTEAAQAPAPTLTPGIAAATLAEDGATFTFPFETPVAGAVFRRGDSVWLVFETAAEQSVAALQPAANPALSSVLSKAEQGLEDGIRVLRLGVKSDARVAASVSGNAWIVRLTETAQNPPEPILVRRDVTAAGKARLAFTTEPASVHWLFDPVLGDRVIVATVAAASHAFVAERRFIELTALPTAAGLALVPYSDDLAVATADGDVVVTGADGLLITSSETVERGQIHSPVELVEHPGRLDFTAWRDPRGLAGYTPTRQKLQAEIAAADPKVKDLKRLELARYLLANGFAAEANGLLTLMGRDDKRLENAPAFHAAKGVALLDLGRAKEAERELRHVTLAGDPDIAVWRGLAAAANEEWPAAADSFDSAELQIASYPADLQARFRLAAAAAALHRANATAAEALLAALPDDALAPAMRESAEYLRGRVLEAQNRGAEALAHYDAAIEGPRGRDQARAKLAKAKLEAALGKATLPDSIAALESLRYDWRGDDIELQTLAALGQLYARNNDVRQGLETMRQAVKNFPENGETQAIVHAMGDIFRGLFLEGGADAMPPVEALGLYYDFRELTPVGREGDEMIRRLAERLASVDLLSQAEELLQHQVDSRLQGAARSQVAIRLAMLYLMDHKPEDALKVVRETRQAQLPDWLVAQRRLLEARALTDLKQYDFALEVLLDDSSEDAERIRADVYWGAENWRAAAEHVEAILGMRWSDAKPLEASERFDVLRAALAYHFSQDAFGLEQLRARYGKAMAGSSDAAAFDLLTAKTPPRSNDLREVTKRIASTDTLETFMKSFAARTKSDLASATN